MQSAARYELWSVMCWLLVAASLLTSLQASGAGGQLDTKITIDLRSQPLGESLRELAKQANLQILFDAKLVGGRDANGVKGTISPRSALERLLRETGLEAHEQAPGIVVIRCTRTLGGIPKIC